MTAAIRQQLLSFLSLQSPFLLTGSAERPNITIKILEIPSGSDYLECKAVMDWLELYKLTKANGQLMPKAVVFSNDISLLCDLDLRLSRLTHQPSTPNEESEIRLFIGPHNTDKSGRAASAAVLDEFRKPTSHIRLLLATSAFGRV